MLRVRMSDTRQLNLHWDLDREAWRLEVRGLDPLQLVELLVERGASVRLARQLRHAADTIDAALQADHAVHCNSAARNGVPTEPLTPNRHRRMR